MPRSCAGAWGAKAKTYPPANRDFNGDRGRRGNDSVPLFQLAAALRLTWEITRKSGEDKGDPLSLQDLVAGLDFGVGHVDGGHSIGLIDKLDVLENIGGLFLEQAKDLNGQ